MDEQIPRLKCIILYYILIIHIFIFIIILILDYVSEIFGTIGICIKTKKLKKAREDLKKMTPPPMNSMLEKQPRSEVLKKREDRKQMKVRDVPPSIPGK
jgi:hypothetical protein